jgi:hypothetical protein
VYSSAEDPLSYTPNFPPRQFLGMWMPEEEKAACAHGVFLVRVVSAVTDLDHDLLVKRIRPIDQVRPC